jgi:class 3 adenylate cyclase
MAARIPNAKFVEVDGIDHLPFYDRSDVFVQHIQAFLTGSSALAVPESRVSTLMFTDIVGSTQMAVAKGNLRFGDLLEAHHKAVRSALAQYRGDEIDIAGDGFLASFDGPARAIKCALAIVVSLGSLDIACRIGLHTGECEIREGRPHGIALHIAARVAAAASARTVFVSQTVKDLVAGSDLTFVDAGLHSLKGLPGEWQLYEVVNR